MELLGPERGRSDSTPTPVPCRGEGTTRSVGIAAEDPAGPVAQRMALGAQRHLGLPQRVGLAELLFPELRVEELEEPPRGGVVDLPERRDRRARSGGVQRGLQRLDSLTGAADADVGLAGGEHGELAVPEVEARELLGGQDARNAAERILAAVRAGEREATQRLGRETRERLLGALEGVA